ncbi:hypothetical protein MPTK1_5g09940 [Marchantia polymorpha subsp. ruderalis]|uniref:Uncharacterized protein n=2 Tax=Marchantia polymorpha TaxID=3197 RepID=A0AAF6BGR7_MARPO|nr:hypothetical protein MARPO_0048s0077 [Marchantia polymorpha]BBN11201.1 hypothetical protein Mp_5g09940 [Marchantia polymorpha subsp. ruderalis]|eukprot:PTQ38968.1 hypothetical protein MARPO_0048s0077 [Marchantia polymorpha]
MLRFWQCLSQRLLRNPMLALSALPKFAGGKDTFRNPMRKKRSFPVISSLQRASRARPRSGPGRFES